MAWETSKLFGKTYWFNTNKKSHILQVIVKKHPVFKKYYVSEYTGRGELPFRYMWNENAGSNKLDEHHLMTRQKAIKIAKKIMEMN